jgi:hypothetical protein
MQPCYGRHDRRGRHRYRFLPILISMGVMIAFMLAAFVFGGSSVGCASAAANSAEKSNLPGSRGALAPPHLAPYSHARSTMSKTPTTRGSWARRLEVPRRRISEPKVASDI